MNLPAPLSPERKEYVIAHVWCIFTLATVALPSSSIMASTHFPGDDAHSKPTPVVPSYFNPISPFFNAYDRFARWREDLGLPHPGSVENLQKEVKGMQIRSFLLRIRQVLLFFQLPTFLSISLTVPAPTSRKVSP